MHNPFPSLILFTTFLATIPITVALPQPPASIPQSILDRAPSTDEHKPANLAPTGITASGRKVKRDTNTAVNPDTHGITGIQAYDSALSKEMHHNYTAQRQTAATAPKAAFAGGGGGRQKKRDCIQPVEEPNGEFNYTVAAGSDAC